MPEFSIESNGMLENTVVYYNGEQLRGVREVFLNLDEEGAFDAILQYQGTDDQLYTKNVLVDFLENVATTDPTFTEEEAQQMTQLMLASDGSLETTSVILNNEEQVGVVSLLVHIKAPQEGDRPEFKAEITYREEDGRLTTEGVF
ncbi:MAG: hypothetical protein EHM43_10030 [Ignavibacteriae bacterium]|nr:MAG: hypothetical protein EHM43_10030 [Ignavibacteriota bacterium]